MMKLTDRPTSIGFMPGVYLVFRRQRWTDWKSRTLRLVQKLLSGSDEYGHVDVLLVEKNGVMKLFSWCYEGGVCVKNPQVLSDCKIVSLGEDITEWAREAIFAFGSFKVSVGALLTSALPPSKLKEQLILRCIEHNACPCTHVPALILSLWLFGKELDNDFDPGYNLDAKEFLILSDMKTDLCSLDFVFRHWAPVDYLAKTVPSSLTTTL